MPNYYSDSWRSNEPGGTTPWSDSWVTGQYAQQLKAGGSHDPEYLKRFETLGKSESTVDDEEGWRTVTNLRNNDPANIESIKQQAAEWKAKGFDVRVQDLDQSHDAEWADLAVRKGQGKEASPEPEAEEGPIVHSDRLTEALERVARWEDPEHPEYHDFSKRIFGPDNEEIADNPNIFDKSAEYSSERPEIEYDFSDDIFLNDSNQAPEDSEAKTKANDLLNSYKNILIG